MTEGNYKWTLLDWAVVAIANISSVVLFYLALSDSVVKCSSDREYGGITSTSVAILNRVCENNDALFFLMLLVAFTLRWWRSLLGWEARQEARVILKRSVGDRPWSMRWSYHWLSIQSTITYLIEVVLIIGQNVFVFFALLLGDQIASYRYMLRSPADEARSDHVTKHNGTGVGTPLRPFNVRF